jgi:hypothetical protein
VRGEPAAGKTALLEYIVEHASGCYDYVAGTADRGSFGLPSSGSSWVASGAPHSNATTMGRQTLHDPTRGFLEGSS